MKDFLSTLDINQTLTGLVALISVIGSFFQILKWYHNKTIKAIMTNRTQNEKLTNEIKSELISHTKDDTKKFDEIGSNFKGLFDITSRMDEKVRLLVDKKIN